MIELRNVFKQFHDHIAIDQASLFIHPGEIVGIIGPSGAGKSTLLRCINFLEQPDRGDVEVQGKNLKNLSKLELREVRHQIGMVFQYFNLLSSTTVYENIALPLRIQNTPKSEIENRVKELLELVHLENKADAYPSTLSGGQKQRVAIARALATRPKVLLCDEATSALDPHNTLAILNLLKKINYLYGITIILITHDMDVIKRTCKRVVVMDKGKILEDRPLAEVLYYPDSPARKMLFQQLAPELPEGLEQALSSQEQGRAVLRLYFQGDSATVPFISEASRELNLNINILLANIDRFDTITCGVMVIELIASNKELEVFINRCNQAKLNVEVLGYVNHSVV